MDDKRISQKELAEILGISPSAVSQWKTCSNISVDILFALSKLFQVTIDELFMEQLAAETHEEKWDRLYNLDKYNWEMISAEGDIESMLVYLGKLRAMNSRFYKLLYKQMVHKISDIEIKELSTIKPYFLPNPFNSQYFIGKYNVPFPMNERDNWISEIINEAMDFTNENAVVWELQRIYQNTKMIEFDKIQAIYNDDVFYAWFYSLPQENKDRVVSIFYKQKVDSEIVYDLIRKGGRIIYDYNDSDLNGLNFSKEELEQFEGEKKPLTKLTDVKKVFMDSYSRCRQFTYEQYQKIINLSAMKLIEAEHKYKKRNPIKYWEFIKNVGYIK